MKNLEKMGRTWGWINEVFLVAFWNFRSWWCSLDNPIGRETRFGTSSWPWAFVWNKSVHMSEYIHVWIYTYMLRIYTHTQSTIYYIIYNLNVYIYIYDLARCLDNSCSFNDFNGRLLEHSDLLGLRALRRVQTSSLRIKRRKFSANKKDDKAAEIWGKWEKRVEEIGCKISWLLSFYTGTFFPRVFWENYYL